MSEILCVDMNGSGVSIENQWNMNDLNLLKFHNKILKIVDVEGNSRCGANIILLGGSKIGVAFPVAQSLGNMKSDISQRGMKLRGGYRPYRVSIERGHFWLILE